MEAIFALWYRDILRFARNKGRLFGSFAMPSCFLWFSAPVWAVQSGLL